jgi:SPP1 gp7 family putative phage head morphogenesis protein
MVIVEPEFDDQTPAYERAEKAVNVPLTFNERRNIVGMDPLPDYDTQGEPLGTAIYLTGSLTDIGEGPDENGKLAPREAKPEPPPNPFGVVGNEPTPLFGAKAGPLKGLRYTLDQAWVPRARESIEKMFRGQRDAIVAKLRSISDENFKRHKNDPDYWWNESREREAALRALRPAYAGITEAVVVRTSKVLPKGDGKAFPQEVESFVLDRAGLRIKNITETTRQAIASAILQGFDNGESPSQVADRIEELTAFNEHRAELIARTETMNAYNAAALQSYREYGVERVTAIDGDQDEECAARDGQEYSLEEALDIEDHPNGTLDWAPAIKAKPDPMLLLLEQLAKAREPVNVTVINGDPKQYREVVDYGLDGSILGSHMEPMDG